MTEDEVIDLLSIVTAYDKRTVGQGELHAWADAARRGRWTFELASEAVKNHYAESADWIMPAHVTQRIKALRSEPPRSGALPAATSGPASGEHRRQVLAWFDNRQAERGPSQAAVRNADAVTCPFCGAKPTRPCWQTWRGMPLASGKTMTRPHPQRIAAADAGTEE